MNNSIDRILALAHIILLDGIRRYALIGLLFLSLAIEASGLMFFQFIHRDIGRASSDFIFSVSWIAGFIFLFFHAVQVIAWDEERRVIHTILARPLSRSEYVLGVFTGLGILLLVLNFFLGAIGWGTLMVIRHSVASEYFPHFSHLFYLNGWLGLFAMQLVVLAVIMLFSGLVRGGFPVLLVSLAFYLICSGLPVVREMARQSTSSGGGILSSKMLQGLAAVFPDFSRLDFKNAIVSPSEIPSFSLVLTNYGVVIIYTVIILWLACIIYQRRDLQ